MLTLTPARIRGRTRRTLLAAALTAAAAVPATADAATVTTSGTKNGTILHYRAAAGEVNDVRVSLPGARIVISDQVPITAAAPASSTPPATPSARTSTSSASSSATATTSCGTPRPSRAS